MRLTLLVSSLIVLVSSTASAEECAQGATCVPPEDLKVFVDLLKEKKCLQSSQPSFELDPITIIVDQDGRIFYSGAEPNPYTLRMKWCSYEAEAKGKVKVIAAMREPETWGLRFRPKAYLGYLPLEPVVYDTKPESGIDAGLMLDLFHVQLANVNVAVGFRSFGLGVGVDVTKNFGAYAGYAMSWASWNHNLNTALWFAF